MAKQEFSASEKLIADLIWLLESPALFCDGLFESPHCWTVAHNRFQLQSFQQKLLNRMLSEPQSLPPVTKSVGHYFEQLWFWLFEISSSLELVTHHRQIIEANRTIGELDFVYCDRVTQQYFHLEVAIKFYLGVPMFSAPSVESGNQQNQTTPSADNKWVNFSSQRQWLGPNQNDRLDIKYQRLLTQQSQLCQQEDVRTLIGLSSTAQVKPEVCLKGVLFYPATKDLLPPEGCNPNHLRGLWCSISLFSDYFSTDERWLLVRKPFWLSQPDALLTEWQSTAAIITLLEAQFTERPSPVLLAHYQKDSQTDSFHFKQLVFVVPNQWSSDAITLLSE